MWILNSCGRFWGLLAHSGLGKAGKELRERLVVCFLVAPVALESGPVPGPWCYKLAADPLTEVAWQSWNESGSPAHAHQRLAWAPLASEAGDMGAGSGQ